MYIKSDLIKTFFILLVLGAVTFIIYLPGLEGGFLLDDKSVLSKLAIINHDITFENLTSYLLESNTGPLKRPVSVMSFLIYGQTWPDEPSDNIFVSSGDISESQKYAPILAQYSLTQIEAM